MDMAQQHNIPKGKAFKTACMIVGNWSGHDAGYISYLSYGDNHSEEMIDTLNHLDHKTIEEILCAGLEIASYGSKSSDSFKLATAPFKANNISKAQLFEIVYKNSISKKVTNDSIDVYLEAFANFFPTTDSIKAWTLIISVDARDRGKLLYRKNNQAISLSQPKCGTILQILFVEDNDPQLWVLGTKGLQSYENGQYVDIQQDQNGQILIKDPNNPLVEIGATEKGDIFGVRRNGEQSLIKPTI